MNPEEENKSFFEKVVKRRNILKNYDKKLEERINEKRLGEKHKGLLAEFIKYESSGQVGFSHFYIPPIIEKGMGDIVIDVEGKEYIDLTSGFAASTIGQCNKEVIEEIIKQSKDLIHFFDFPTVPRIKLAAKLIEVIPGDFEKKVQFSVTGSDAVENAIHAARWYTGCSYILAAIGAYHGVQMGSVGITSKGGIASYYYPVPPNNNGIILFPYAYCYRCPFGKNYPNCDIYCVTFIENTLLKGKESPLVDQKAGVSNIAGLIIEPMQCSSGYIMPPDDYLRGLKRLADQYNFLFIADEIQTGVGRTGKLWAVEHYGVEPEIMVIGKGIGGGLPISAIVTKKEILNNWAPTAHISTFAGYTLGCSVALKIFEFIESKDILKNSNNIGEYFYNGLLELQDRHEIIGDVTGGKGLFLALELVKDRKSKEPASEEAFYVRNKALEYGLIFAVSGYYYNRITLIPAITIRKESVDNALKILDRLFNEIKK